MAIEYNIQTRREGRTAKWHKLYDNFTLTIKIEIQLKYDRNSKLRN